MSTSTDAVEREARSAANPVDPWRFAGRFLANMLSGVIPEEPSHAEIPFAKVGKPLSECRVALLSTAGISMRDDEPFDMEFERQHPTRGDSSWRRLRSDATAESIHANHLHIDTGYIERDLNVALPLEQLHALAAEGVIGEVAPSHYSIMGFQGNDSSKLEQESAPEIAAAMKSEEVDLALLAPV
jgi:D-proline reductase (dithiol) PrdB